MLKKCQTTLTHHNLKRFYTKRLEKSKIRFILVYQGWLQIPKIPETEIARSLSNKLDFLDKNHFRLRKIATWDLLDLSLFDMRYSKLVTK